MGRTPKRAVEKGPAAGRVAANVRALREQRRLTLGEVAHRLEDLGRTMLPTGVSKIEQGDRRVDVDDLVSLALALDVTPNRLLLCGGASDIDLLPLTSTDRETTSHNAWKWACGDEPLADRYAPQHERAPRVERLLRWKRENRPQDQPPLLTKEDQRRWREALQRLDAAIKDALDDGLPLDHVIGQARTTALVRLVQAKPAGEPISDEETVLLMTSSEAEY